MWVSRWIFILIATLSWSQFACVDQWIAQVMPAKPTPQAEPANPAANLNRANDEILSEMFQVTFFAERQEIEAREFAELSQSLKQGASLEGVYRGLISSSRYRTLESQGGAATPEVLKAFALELARVREGAKDLSRYSGKDAAQVPEVSFPDESDSGVEVKTFPLVTPQAEKRLPVEEDAAELARTFVGASVFTLKRVLCEAALSRIDELGGSHDQVAQWYAKLANRLAAAHVDFGLSQRNSSDSDFHFSWAMKASDERIKWEVLNRYHRYLNALSVRR
jgi:hypothetical protein